MRNLVIPICGEILLDSVTGMERERVRKRERESEKERERERPRIGNEVNIWLGLL